MLPHPPRLRLTPRDSWHAPCTSCGRSAHATVGRGEVAQSGTGETTTAANKWPKDVAAGVRAAEPLTELPTGALPELRSDRLDADGERAGVQLCGCGRRDLRNGALGGEQAAGEPGGRELEIACGRDISQRFDGP